jgi:hypothetical protein
MADEPAAKNKQTLDPAAAAEMVATRLRYMQQNLEMIRGIMARYAGLKAMDVELEKRGALDAVRSLLKGE